MTDGQRGKAADRETGDFLPVLILDAPAAFVARKGSLERLRKDYRITRRQALELVLLGLAKKERKSWNGQ